jgi:hypothetical protein
MSGKRGGHEWNPVNYEKGNRFYGISSNGKIFVAVGDHDLLWTSTDGLNWTERNPRAGVFHSCRNITYGGDKFVAVGGKGFIMTSSNGISGWKHRKTDTTEGLWGITYAKEKGLYVATGNKGVILTSPNGIKWSKPKKIAGENILDVVFGEGLFVAVGSRENAGGIYTSSDGINWKRQKKAEKGLTSAAYGGGTFVIGGRNGLVYTSADGKQWVKRNTGTSKFVQDIIYTGSGFVAVGGRALAMTSTNGTSWTTRDSRAITTLYGVASNGSALVAAGLARGLVISFFDPDAVKPFVKLKSPNKHILLKGKKHHPITWIGINVDRVKLEFSSDGGKTFTTIKKKPILNKGHCDWTVPDVQSYECLVRVSDASNSSVSDMGDEPFSINIDSTVPSSIAITSPKPDEKLTGGSTYNIAWKGSKKYDKVDIEYNNGSKWNKLVKGAPDTGTYAWKVPQLSTSKARLWMKGWSLTGHAVDTFKGHFAIGTSFSVVSPNGGEKWESGSINTILWGTNGEVDKVNIEYSTDAGSSWKSIANAEKNEGSYNWKLPAVQSADCLVRITDTADANRKVTSSDVFEITKEDTTGIENISIKINGTINLSFNPNDGSLINLNFTPD